MEPPGENLYEMRLEAAGWQVYAWDDWYDYPLSYWREDRKTGVDRGEPSRLVYAFHVLLGHHGWFSLTPVWLLALAGIPLAWRRPEQRPLVLLLLILSLVTAGFYIARPLIDRNYGGVSCGARWLLWLVPFWLLLLPAAAQRLSPTWWGRAIALALLAVSVISAIYPGNNPWTHPWLFDYWTELGWIEYP